MNLTPEQQKELDQLSGMVDRASYVQKYGSFSQRNPELGKMVTCAICEQRIRQTENHEHKYLTLSADVVHIKGRKNPRLSRNHPPLFEMCSRLKELENRGIDYEGLSGVVEDEIVRGKKAKAKRIRDQQKKSRKANRHAG